MDNLWLMVNSYPLVNIQKAIEHGTFIVDFPIKNANFPIVMLVYQRVGRELLTAKRTVIPFGGLIGTEYPAKLDNIHKFMDLIQQNRPIPVVFPNNFEFDLHPSPFNWMFNYILIAFCRRKTTTNWYFGAQCSGDGLVRNLFHHDAHMLHVW